jgi:hypothetical protein
MCEICHMRECPPRCPSYHPEVVAYCEGCNEPIYYGEDCYKFPDGTTWHDDCLYDSYHTTAGE